VANPVSNKSFFNADKVEFKWNKYGIKNLIDKKIQIQLICLFFFISIFSGTGLLILCSTEVSQNSYYGDTNLHHLNTNGESQIVQLSNFEKK
jgi:uncharacterized protein with WD repeat